MLQETVWALSNIRSSLRRVAIITSCFESEHTITRNTGTRNDGTRNTRGTIEQCRNNGKPEQQNAEQQRNRQYVFFFLLLLLLLLLFQSLDVRASENPSAS